MSKTTGKNESLLLSSCSWLLLGFLGQNHQRSQRFCLGTAVHLRSCGGFPHICTLPASKLIISGKVEKRRVKKQEWRDEKPLMIKSSAMQSSFNTHLNFPCTKTENGAESLFEAHQNKTILFNCFDFITGIHAHGWNIRFWDYKIIINNKIK